MKKVILYISILLLIISLIVILKRIIPIKPFYINDEYYESSLIKEITIEELNKLTEEKKSFGLFIYQPMCIVSSNFNEIVTSYSKTNQITFYKIEFSKIKGTSLNKKITYYPSFVLYKEGNVKTYLDATKNSDIEYFSSEKGFSKWINRYLKLKENTESEAEKEETKEDTTINNEGEITLEGVTKTDGKVNIYFFWGNGCPHCKEEFKFLSEIETEYKELYNLHAYEVWYNEENEKILKEFGKRLNIEIKGVPFTIIGEKVFSGFGPNTKEEIKEAIKTESQNNYDIYFDKKEIEN